MTAGVISRKYGKEITAEAKTSVNIYVMCVKIRANISGNFPDLYYVTKTLEGLSDVELMMLLDKIILHKTILQYAKHYLEESRSKIQGRSKLNSLSQIYKFIDNLSKANRLT